MENPLEVLGIPNWLIAQESKRGNEGLEHLKRAAKLLYRTLSQITHPDSESGSKEDFARIAASWEALEDLEILEFWVERFMDTGMSTATVQQANHRRKRATEESVSALRRLLANSSPARVVGTDSKVELVFGFDRANAYGEAALNGEHSFFVIVDGDKRCEVREQAHPALLQEAPLEIMQYRRGRDNIWRGQYVGADKADNPKLREYRFDARTPRAPVRLVGAIPASAMKTHGSLRHVPAGAQTSAALITGTRIDLNLVWFDDQPDWLSLVQPRLSMGDYGVVAEEENSRIAIIGKLMAIK